MTRTKKKVYRSMREVEMEFFPKSYRKKMEEEERKKYSFGEILAKESLEKIREKLLKH